ncbi:MAG: hypothetical protein ACUVV6_07320 [Thermoplasmatota archaeon]
MMERRGKELRRAVRRRYGRIARSGGSCCSRSCSCGSGSLGYTEEELGSLPEGADLGLGCGNPVALASIKRGGPWSTWAPARA